MHQLQHYHNSPPPMRPGPNSLQTITIILALLYWISPIDVLPFIPIDDIFVMIMAMLFYNARGPQ